MHPGAEEADSPVERVTLWCGCVMAVLRGAAPQASALRAIARKNAGCRIRAHRVGERVYLWELLPPPRHPQWTR